MIETIGKDEIRRMFSEAAARIRSEQTLLSELDSVAGDGDQGTTMVRVVDCLEASVSENDRSLKDTLRDAGWSVSNVDGGASGSILGTFLTGLGEGCPDKPALDCEDFAKAGRAGLAAVQRQTKAQPGDKTMMDALVPAIEALSVSAAKGEPVELGLKAAAQAAGAGADRTRTQVARYGRSKSLGQKTLGHPDPGAVSLALIFEGFFRGVSEDEHRRQA